MIIYWEFSLRISKGVNESWIKDIDYRVSTLRNFTEGREMSTETRVVAQERLRVLSFSPIISDNSVMDP